jgi:hypothetical protein
VVLPRRVVADQPLDLACQSCNLVDVCRFDEEIDRPDLRSHQHMATSSLLRPCPVNAPPRAFRRVRERRPSACEVILERSAPPNVAPSPNASLTRSRWPPRRSAGRPLTGPRRRAVEDADLARPGRTADVARPFAALAGSPAVLTWCFGGWTGVISRPFPPAPGSRRPWSAPCSRVVLDSHPHKTPGRWAFRVRWSWGESNPPVPSGVSPAHGQSPSARPIFECPGAASGGQE